MTIEEFRRYSDDEEMIERVEECLKQIDEGGSCEGKYELAVLLESIHNKNLDEEVFELYKDVAEGSMNPAALLSLAVLYHKGKGCKRDIAKSFACCYEAVKMGNLEAETYLAQIFRDDSKELALYWAEHAGNQNDPQALMIAADLLDRLGATRRNGQKYYDAATEYYRKAASLGIAGAKGKATLLGKLKRALRW